jgi:hypothetical protein
MKGSTRSAIIGVIFGARQQLAAANSLVLVKGRRGRVPLKQSEMVGILGLQRAHQNLKVRELA